ncbi:SRPBCC domain-containing protein [Streptomyces rectiviolaceus]|uniref:SRPBCC domain-containing protein n=1 Tax=Streptomyces rectiviolaceus TaxID=332591 RepID=A0ABP6MVD8_9ACTN
MSSSVSDASDVSDVSENDTAEGTVKKRSWPRRRPVLSSLLVLAVALTGYTVWTNTQPVRITASMELRATPDEVWRVLSDFEKYPEWNPFITSAEVTSDSGRVEEGATLRNRMHDASGDTTFTPEIQTVEPGRELKWLGKVEPGWIADGQHRFHIERIGPDRVRFTQTERFTGVAVPFLKGHLEEKTLPQFHAMNAALQERLDALR